ncbi:hypothetical protein SO180_42300, partial [Bradyrhizobium sp. UFLA05-112]
LQTHAIEAYVIHAASIAVSREHRRAKSDRIDTELLMRSLLGWLRGEKRHCSMVAIPTMAQEDTRRPGRERQSLVSDQTRIVNRVKAVLALVGIGGFNPRLRKAAQKLQTLRTAEGTPLPDNTHAELCRDLERLSLVRDQIRAIERERLQRLAAAPAAATGPHAMVRLIARVLGIAIETADMLVHEALSRNLRDRRAVARYAGLTGAPDESGKRRRAGQPGIARDSSAITQIARQRLMHQHVGGLDGDAEDPCDQTNHRMGTRCCGRRSGETLQTFAFDGTDLVTHQAQPFQIAA